MSDEKSGDTLSVHILNQLTRFDSKFDKFDERFDKYNETLIRNTITLEDHVKRTNLLETKIFHVETEVTGLKEHMTIVKGVMNFFRFILSEKGRLFIKIMIPVISALASYAMISKETIGKLLDFLGM